MAWRPKRNPIYPWPWRPFYHETRILRAPPTLLYHSTIPLPAQPPNYLTTLLKRAQYPSWSSGAQVEPASRQRKKRRGVLLSQRHIRPLVSSGSELVAVVPAWPGLFCFSPFYPRSRRETGFQLCFAETALLMRWAERSSRSILIWSFVGESYARGCRGDGNYTKFTERYGCE